MTMVKMYGANEGDAFLISLNNESFNILVDMGFKETYENEIKKDLLLLNAKGKQVDLLVITHIDNDHISGVLNFIQDNGEEMKIIKVKEVWHNSFKHLNFNKEKTILPKEETKALIDLKNLNTNNNAEDGLSDIGAKEGTTLASLLFKYKYRWNSAFNNNAVNLENLQEVTIGDVKFILLSPNNKKLERLEKIWKDKLQSIFYNFKLTEDEIFDDAFELYIKNNGDDFAKTSDISNIETDDLISLASKNENESSAPNGSSIAFIIEFQNLKLLFLADAHHGIITEQLEILKKNNYDLNFDIVKISHHGSNKNISTKLISLFNSKYYLFSTNGKKNSHPELEAISKIILKKSSELKTLCFNYRHEKLNFLETPRLKKLYNYDIKFTKEIPLN